MSFHVVRRKLYVLGPGPRCRKTYYLLLKTYNLKIFRCLYRRCPPLPIPNREVKPARADGTAVTCGRVGRCQILKGPITKVVGPLFLPHFFLTECPRAWPGPCRTAVYSVHRMRPDLVVPQQQLQGSLMDNRHQVVNLQFIPFIG